MAGWGDDPELERLRELLADGWEVAEITEDPNAPGGPLDTVKLQKGDATACALLPGSPCCPCLCCC